MATTATFAIEIEDEGAVAGAAAVSKELDKMAISLKRDLAAVGRMNAALKAMKGAAKPNEEAIARLTKQLAETKNRAAATQTKYLEMGGSLGRLSKAKTDASKGSKSLLETFARMPGPVGRAASGLHAASTSSLLAAGAMAAVVVAAVAVTAAIIATTAALLRYGVASANARRDERSRLESLTLMRSRFRGSAADIGVMQSAIDRVSSSSALSRGKVEEYASQLYRTGVRGRNLEVALGAMATRGAVLGDESARAFGMMAAGAARGGRSVDALAERVNNRLGGAAQRRMLSLGVITEKFGENINSIFSGLEIDGLLSSIRSISDLFGQNTATGRALKAIVDILFQPLINQAQTGTPIVKRFFQGIIIAALQTIIVVLQVRNWFRRTFGSSEMFRGLDTAKVALYAGAAAFGLFAVAAIAASIVVVAAAFAIASPFIIAGAVIYGIVEAFGAIKRVGGELVDEWRQIGPMMVDGIVNGLTRAKDRAIGAVRGLGQSMLGAFRDVFQIRSPSRVMIRHTERDIGGAAEIGLQRATPRVSRAMEGLVPMPASSPSDVADGAERAGAAARSASSTAFTFGDIIVQAASGDARAIAEQIRDEISSMLEGVGVEMAVGA